MTRTNLVRQTILAETSTAANVNVRVISDNSVDYASKSGWYLPLIYPSDETVATGERIVSNLLLSNGKLIVTSLIPSSATSCDPGGDSWLMEINPKTGGRLSYSTLDVTNDGAINDSDKVTVTVIENGETKTITTPGSAVKRKGLITDPTILKTECTTDCEVSDPDEFKYITNSKGEIEKIAGKNSSATIGRQSWRQIR